jgi:hypothetical protein
MRLYRAIVHWIQSVTRINNAHAAILERPDPRPTTEVLNTLPEEMANVLEMARNSRAIRSKLPREYQEILEQEELEQEV